VSTNTQRYAGRVVLITGGGSGLGRATALRVAAEGAAVAVLDINEAGGHDVVREIRETGGGAEFLRVDVGNRASVLDAVDAAHRRFGRIDVAVNGAGVTGQRAEIPDVTEDDWNRVVAINLNGVFFGMQAQLPIMAAQGGGSIVNIASILGVVGRANASAYVATKHAVVGLTKAAAFEWGTRNVRVNAVAPSYIPTPMTEPRLDADTWAALSAQHAFKRCGTPDDVAAMIAFLGSDDAKFLTAAVHLVDGGYTAG